jgi:hypothetical protein
LTTLSLDDDGGEPGAAPHLPDPRAVDPAERLCDIADEELADIVLTVVVDVARRALTAAAGPTDERRLADLLGRALRAATAELVDHSALSPDQAAGFIEDPARFRDAVDQLRVLTSLAS